MNLKVEFIICLLYIPALLLLVIIALKNGGFYSFCIVFRELRFFEAFINTFVIGIIVAFINLFVGGWIGKVILGKQGFWAFILDTIVTIPLIVPVFLMLSLLHIFMIKLGFTDSKGAVIIIHLVPSLPYSIKICRNGYSGLGNKYFEQAALMGASKIRIFFEVSLPLMKSAYQYVFALSFAISIGQYATTAIIGGGSVITLSMLYFPFFNSVNSSYMSAFSIIFIALPLVIVFVFKIVYGIINFIIGKM